MSRPHPRAHHVRAGVWPRVHASVQTVLPPAPPPPSPPPDPGKAGWGFMLRQGLHSHQSRLPPGTSRGLWPCVHSPGLGEIPASQSRERWVGVQTRSGSWFPPVVCPSHQARVPPTNHVSLLSIVSRLICPAHRSRVPPSSCFSHQSRVPAPIACPLPPITSPYYQSHLPSSKRISFPPIACVAPPPAPALHVPPINRVSHQSRVPPTNRLSRPPMASPLQLASPGGHGAGSGRDPRGRGCRR